MIKLTRYDDGGPLYIDPKTVTAVVQLSHVPAKTGLFASPEIGRRTRVHYGLNDMIELVCEEADDVMTMIEAAK